MPLWFGSKSSLKDARKKKSLENLFDGARRRFKNFKDDNISPRNIAHGLESASDSGSGTWMGSGSPSPTTVTGLKFGDNEENQPQPYPLPCAPPTSGKSMLKGRGNEECLGKFPLLPLPSPEGIINITEHVQGDNVMVFTSESTSSVSSQGSNDMVETWQSTGSSVIFSPQDKPSYRTFPENCLSDGFGQEHFGQLSHMPNRSMYSPRSPLPGRRKDTQISQRSSGASDSPSMSPRRVLNRDLTSNKSNLDNSAATGLCSSPAFGFKINGNIDAIGQTFIHHSRTSPELSPGPSPKRSPCPSPRPLSATASPLHSQTTCIEYESGFKENEVSVGHRLPLPPDLALVSAYSSVPRSPARTDKPVNLATGWSKGSLLGSGTFGQVYTGFHSETGLMCAIKEVVIIPDDRNSIESTKQLAQEISLLSQMQHPNIVQYYGTETIEDKLYIYIEYMSGGSIHKLLQQYGAMPESCIRGYTQQILSGLEYLHSKNTVHRDIKGANILVDKGGIVKLADFGMAKHISAKSFPLSFKGSPYWMAPEVIRNRNGYDVAVDIWSLGCTVLEMATGKPPWSQFEGVAAMFKIGSTKDIPDIPNFLSDEGKDFLRNCLQRNPHERPTAKQLLEHPFIRPDGQLNSVYVIADDMQTMSISESRSYSRNIMKTGNTAVTLSPSSSPKFQPNHAKFGVLSPSAKSASILKSGCSSPTSSKHGYAQVSTHGMVIASSNFEAYDHSVKSTVPQIGNLTNQPAVRFVHRSNYQQKSPQQTPDGSPRRGAFSIPEESIFSTILEQGEVQHYCGVPALSSEYIFHQPIRSPRQYFSAQFHPDPLA